MYLLSPADVYRLTMEVTDLRNAVSSALCSQDRSVSSVLDRFATAYGPSLAAEVMADYLDEAVADEASVDRAVLLLLSRCGDECVRMVLEAMELRRSSSSVSAPTPPCP